MLMCTGDTGAPGPRGVRGVPGPVGNPGATGAMNIQVQMINPRVKRQAGCPGNVRYNSSQMKQHS